MTTEVRHPIAYFEPPTGKRREISQESLENEELRKELATGVLTDKDEFQQFFVRRSQGGLYHFALRRDSTGILGGERARVSDPKERSEEHEDALVRIHQYLSGTVLPSGVKKIAGKRTPPRRIPGGLPPAAKIYTNFYFSNEKGQKRKRKEVLANLRADDYRWGVEVCRYVGTDGLVRHDVFGQSMEPRMSVLRPNIAIEIVHTSPPSIETLKLMFEATRTTSLIVLFHFLNHPKGMHYLFQCLSTAEGVELRTAWFIADGVLYRNQNAIATWESPNAHELFLERIAVDESGIEDEDEKEGGEEEGEDESGEG